MSNKSTNELSVFNSNNILKKEKIFDEKSEALKKYYDGHQDLIEKMSKNPDGSTIDAILNCVITEMFKDSDDLLGNRIILTKQKNLQEANDVTAKRSSLLAKIADISLKKQEINAKTQDVDLNAPAFFLFQQICFDKLKDTLLEMQMEDEKIQVVIMKWAEKMKNWDKILTEKINSYRANN
jgi:hypothetical protein